MSLRERRVGIASLAAAVLLILTACNDSKSVTAPSAASSGSSMANAAGAWTGSFQSYSTACSGSPVSATLQQNGSDVTGLVVAKPCGIRGTLRGKITGSELAGRLDMSGCRGGAVTGTVSASGLSLTIGDFTKPVLTGDTIVAYGGEARLHR